MHTATLQFLFQTLLKLNRLLHRVSKDKTNDIEAGPSSYYKLHGYQNQSPVLAPKELLPAALPAERQIRIAKE